MLPACLGREWGQGLVSVTDREQLSIQQARELVGKAAAAQKQFACFRQDQVDAVVRACADAAATAAEPLARLAVEETGFGNVADKITKNRLAALDLHQAIRPMRTVGIVREDKEKKIIEVATPVGVVAAIIPSTNPTSTAIYKTLIAVKARNAIVHSPHPAAVRCIREAVRVLAEAAARAGAPEGLIACLEHPTMQGTQELMRHRETGVILATGGAGLVRAAYSSGKPAYGVGPGNVPAYIERSADIRKAVADIFAGKTFDYGTICSAEQSIVVEDSIRDQVLEECRRQGAYFLSAEEAQRVGELVIQKPAYTPNPKIVGRPATVIAEMAGIRVPPDTRVLIAQLDPSQVGREHPLSLEKLSPVLAFYSVPGLQAAIELCTRILQHGGMGHTIAVHSKNDAAIREFGLAVPAFRVCVNTSAVHGSIGYSTNLFPAMTLGCGALGGNITSDNIGPHHLMNIKRIAWESRPVEHRTIPAELRMVAHPGAAAPVAMSAPGAVPFPRLQPVAHEIPPPRDLPQESAAVVPRQRIAQIVERVFRERGIARGAGAAKLGETPATPPRPQPASAGELADFVSEADVRSALLRQQKIPIGPKTILTPAARDLGFANEIFIESQPDR
jgi:acetaldehyde dehydrogenase (acetylating)